jgi:hypothetical protein
MYITQIIYNIFVQVLETGRSLYRSFWASFTEVQKYCFPNNANAYYVYPAMSKTPVKSYWKEQSRNKYHSNWFWGRFLSRPHYTVNSLLPFVPHQSDIKQNFICVPFLYSNCNECRMKSYYKLLTFMHYKGKCVFLWH